MISAVQTVPVEVEEQDAVDGPAGRFELVVHHEDGRAELGRRRRDIDRELGGGVEGVFAP